MRTYWLLLGGMSLLLLLLFGLASALEIGILTDPQPFLDRAGLLGAAALGAGLLVADVFLPIPASLLMIAHGALFGITLGTLVSLAGSVGAAALAFAVGRRFGGRLHRLVPPEERRRADALLERWGELAVVATRPLPILAESVALLAGTSPLTWRRFLAASLAGNLPASFLYAVTGATAARLDSALLVFALVLAAAALTWVAGRRMRGLEKQPGV